MPLDGKIEQFTRAVPEGQEADPFSLGSLIAWLEKRPAEDGYVYLCGGHCLLAQYFAAIGFKRVTVFGDSFVHGRDVPGSYGQEKCRQVGWAIDLPPNFNTIATRLPHTFGAAFARAWSLESATRQA